MKSTQRCFFMVGVMLFLLIASVLIDRNLSSTLYQLASTNSSLIRLTQVLAKFTCPVVILVWIVTCLLFFTNAKNRPSAKRLILAVPVIALVSYFLSQTIQSFLYTDRPFVSLNLTALVSHKPDSSFPSDHAVVSFAVAMPFFYFGLPRILAFTIISCAMLGAFARVAAALHWLSDIVGAFLLVFIVTNAVVSKITTLRDLSNSESDSTQRESLIPNAPSVHQMPVC